MLRISFLLIAFIFMNASQATASEVEKVKSVLLGMQGCYLVDYSYTETESLKDGYQRDKRVYDVNKDKSIKEWIYAEELSPNRLRLQHILFSTDLSGKLEEGTLLKHQAEDWEYSASFLYDFVAPQHWNVKSLEAGLWTRKITSLDDGLRYQCAAAWDLSKAFPEWSCANFAPIPGRETRDMGRKDYNTLDRGTKIVAYGNSWLERQNNIKTIYANGLKTPLASEVGKNWYVRLPDSDCAGTKSFIESGKDFWSLLRETWDEVFVGDTPFVEKSIAGQPSRYMKMMDLQEQLKGQDLKNAEIRRAAKQSILNLIQEYREAH